MNKDEFRKSVTPLTPKEIRYRDHPETAGSFFSPGKHGLMLDENGIYIFSFVMPGIDSKIENGLYAKRSAFGQIPNFVLSTQTRYSKVPLHKHDYIEIAFMYSGHCITNVDGNDIRLRENDMIIYDSGVVHTVYPTGEHDLLFNITMPRNYFSKFFHEKLHDAGAASAFLATVINENQNHDHFLHFRTGKSPFLRDLIETLYCEYLDPRIGNIEALDNYINLIFIEMIRCYQNEIEEAYRKENNRGYLTEVLRYMEENCTDCTLEETAEKYGYHPNYLSRAIRKATGESFKDFVTAARMNRAADMLKHSDEPVSLIALACGYTNQSFFYKKFEKHFGTTPAEYRRTDRSAALQR